MISERHKRLIPTIVGPTASGKSDLGIELALRLSHTVPGAVAAGSGEAIVPGAVATGCHGEIVNLDSVQVYRGLYVATAKVPPEERRGVPHHLVDIAEPTENFTAGQYARVASGVIQDIEARGRIPILVGGTGFYLRALVSPLFDSPETNLDLRRRIKNLMDRSGPDHLHRMLKRLDPASAERISPKDWSRTMRALEYRFQTRSPISRSQPATGPAPELASRIVIIALSPPREELYAKINARADLMFERGLVEEVRGLIESGVPPDAKAFQAHGYRRVVEYIQGKISKEDALEQMKLDTRHYAKRQWTWWRAWPGVHWIHRFGNDPAAIDEALTILENFPA